MTKIKMWLGFLPLFIKSFGWCECVTLVSSVNTLVWFSCYLFSSDDTEQAYFMIRSELSFISACLGWLGHEARVRGDVER